MSRKRQRTFRPVNYNAGDIAWYRSALLREISAMNKDVRSEVRAIFESNPVANPQPVKMADDASPVRIFRDAIRGLASKWMSRFLDIASGLSDGLVDRTSEAVDRNLKASARKEGITIQMQWTEAMSERQEAIIAENVSLIKSIPEKYFTEVEGMVYRAVAKGGDRKMLTDELMQGFSKREGITRRRAEFIARDQVRKATSALSAVRQQAAGITHGEWIHSAGQANPRHSHVKAGADRLEFDLSKGAYLDGEWIMPGELPNCLPSWADISLAAGCKTLWRRPYSGKLTKLVTVSGEVVEATPNHPVLTQRGWVAIGDVNAGDYVVRVSDGIGSSVSHDHNQHNPSFSKVFELLEEVIGGCVATAGGEFHGDRANHDVDTINIDGLLRSVLDSSGAKDVCELTFTQAMIDRFSFLNRDRSLDSALSRLTAAPESVISSLCDCLALIKGSSDVKQANGFGDSASFNAFIAESLLDAASAYAKVDRDIFLANATGVHGNDFLIREIIAIAFLGAELWNLKPRSSEVLAEVVSTDGKLSCGLFESESVGYEFLRVVDNISSEYSGHVYNLETVNGWYLSASIVYHNCSCSWRPILKF